MIVVVFINVIGFYHIGFMKYMNPYIYIYNHNLFCIVWLGYGETILTQNT